MCAHCPLLSFFRLCTNFKPSHRPWAIGGLQPYWDLCLCPLLPWSDSTKPEQWQANESTFLFLPASCPPAAPGPKGRPPLPWGELTHLWTGSTGGGGSGMRLMLLSFLSVPHRKNGKNKHVSNTSERFISISKEKTKKELFVALKREIADTVSTWGNIL